MISDKRRYLSYLFSIFANEKNENMAFEATKREWGELYAFFRLLADGFVHAGMSDGKKNEALKWPVAMVQREEHDGTRQYIVEAENIHIVGENIDKHIPREDFSTVAELVFDAVKQSKEYGVMSPDGVEEFLDEVAVHLSLKYDWRCAWFSPENFPVTLHHPKLIEKLIGKRFKKGLMNSLELDAAIGYLSQNFFDILPEEGYRVDTILERAETLVRRKGIRVFILDPYNCLEHQIPSGQSETQYISEFLEKLRSFARRRQVLVILAAHPTKMKKDPMSGKFPVPTMYDISGSAAFFNKADFGIAIERDRARGVTRVHVQKVKFRHLGQPGVASFQYNTCCGRFVPMQESKSPDIPDEDPKWDNSNWLVKKMPVQGEIL